MADPVVRHFLICRRVKFDFRRPRASYSALNVVYRYRPPRGYPFVVPRLWVFVSLIGTGSHEFWVEVAYRGRLDADPVDTDPADLVGSYGPYVVHFGETPALITRGWVLRAVPFGNAGWYEFRLLHRGELLAEEPIELED